MCETEMKIERAVWKELLIGEACSTNKFRIVEKRIG
jgi:hypothetical protein